MTRALVVNCSASDWRGHPKNYYNLGAAKLANWLRSQGYVVVEMTGPELVALPLLSFGYDLVALSVIFSWHAPIARDIALRVAGMSEVWCGGPGMTALAKWWQSETGLDCTPGIDARFERQPGDYPFTFAARGCPVGCWFCVVPKLEGKTFTLDWNFRPAPTLCDNNLSALPDDFQDHIIARYAESGVKLKDCNSGFEPRTFTDETYERWRGKFVGPWRFAFDEIDGERGQIESLNVARMTAILKDEKPRKKQVYVLVGNEPFDRCLARVEAVIAMGCEPHCQYVLPLNWLGDPATLRPRHDWDFKLGRDFCRFYNTHGWKSYPLRDYKPRVNEPPPFAERVA